MDSSSPIRPRFHEDPGIDLPEYRALSVLALAALAGSLASLVVLVEPDAWVLPLLGIALSTLALVRIVRSEQRLTGRWLAIASLGLSVAMGAAAPADRLYYDSLIRREAEQFGDRWFELLRNYEPARAFELTRHPENRLPPGSRGAVKDPERQRELDAYMTSPVVQKLLTLGDKLQVSCERTNNQKRGGSWDAATSVYRIECQPAGRPEVFRVALELVRWRVRQPDDSGKLVPVAQWQIRHAEEVTGEPR
jgi:hypothetical protein